VEILFGFVGSTARGTLCPTGGDHEYREIDLCPPSEEEAGSDRRAALQRISGLQFSIIETTGGADSVSRYSTVVLGRRASATIFFGKSGKVCQALATYTA
jgi:hypothetical protein